MSITAFDFEVPNVSFIVSIIDIIFPKSKIGELWLTISNNLLSLSSELLTSFLGVSVLLFIFFMILDKSLIRLLDDEKLLSNILAVLLRFLIILVKSCSISLDDEKLLSKRSILLLTLLIMLDKS
ncbi:hypothetical protein CNEO2_610002 [Clostridium neonatale]|nr:hypothetical protein CNEO2_610002 [Clostridium neonatale]